MQRAIGIAALVGLTATVAVIAARLRWDQPGPPAQPDPLLQHAQTAATAQDDPNAAVVERLCSTCHMLPQPDCEPRDLWPDKIRQMYGYARNERPLPKSQLPPIDVPIAYWTARAPEFLPVPDDAMGSPPSPLGFRHHMIALEAIPNPPSVSSVNFVQLADDGPTQLLVCDMRHGVVVLWTPSRPPRTARIIARVAHPSHTRVVDLDGDGLRDILVANLGDFWPVDTTQGSVVWLRNRGNGRFETVALMEGLGRVNDIQPADFDDDGDLDLVVAVFGNLTTGMVLYLENSTQDYASPDFEPVPLDYHTGTTDVPVVDLNGDGHPDFIALQAQENEHVIAFLNRGWGSFRQETIYRAPHPRWGSTGIRLVDLDGDGDMDVLFNHGDAVQVERFPRPYHGFSWLENQGRFPFTYHRLAHLPGAHTSLFADLDGDGDLDLVSSAFVPAFNRSWPDAEKWDAVVWLEQTSPGQYRRYALEAGTPFHPCATLGDYDGDGDVDVVLGNFSMAPLGTISSDFCLTILENRLVPDRRPPSR